MGRKVRCPKCRDKFYIHGFEALKTCYNCGKMFNPQRHFIEKESGECLTCGEVYMNVPIDWKKRDDGRRYGMVYCPNCNGVADPVGFQKEYE